MGSKNVNQRQIKKESDIMNIYTFGNIEEMKKFNKNEIDKEFDIKTDVPFFDGKYHNYNWYFRFYFQELNKELIDKISAHS